MVAYQENCSNLWHCWTCKHAWSWTSPPRAGHEAAVSKAAFDSHEKSTRSKFKSRIYVVWQFRGTAFEILQARPRVSCAAGNDLARCLDWGGGLYAVQQRGLAAMLHDVEHAIMALLDRWTVCIEATPQPATPILPLQRMGSLGHADASKVCFLPLQHLLIALEKIGIAHLATPEALKR